MRAEVMIQMKSGILTTNLDSLEKKPPFGDTLTSPTNLYYVQRAHVTYTLAYTLHAYIYIQNI